MSQFDTQAGPEARFSPVVVTEPDAPPGLGGVSLAPQAGAPRRRAAPRYRVELEIDFTTEHNFYQGFVENLSEGGLFVATHQLKPIGEMIQFNIDLAGAHVMGLGEVRWTREANEETGQTPGMGLRFVRLDPGCHEA
ncbi:MAG: TIGR02266 family protein, partial [Myxococcota bacterium]